ncbi:hypothetical protein ABT364_26000 [Massilia sp. SR12]
MDDENYLRKIAAWVPLDGFGEDECLAAVHVFTTAINQYPDLTASVNEGSYENFVSVYVNSPAEAVRESHSNGNTLLTYSGLLIYFHHLSPVAAVGGSQWQETLSPNGAVAVRAFGGLDIPGLLSSDLVPSRVKKALQKTPYSIQPPAYFAQFAPRWFAPLGPE